jgi:hypothetical protein
MVETGLVQTRAGIGQWTVQKRKGFNVVGEQDSHDSTYTGIPSRARSSLPLMTAEERILMVGAAPTPPQRLFDVSVKGHPLSWSEKKPINWYTEFLSDVAAGIVIDFTPGSGAMARACLDAGIQYFGICRTPQHMSWLVNVLNRAAVESTTRSGTALYEQDLASCIAGHFKEVLQELHAQDETAAHDDAQT